MELQLEILPDVVAPLSDMEWGIIVGIGIVIIAT
jgi:hypothetical protein